MRPKTFFNFFGGKWRAALRYPKPSYNTIIEPFAGAAGYSVTYWDKNVILVDIDPIICNTWQYLIKATEKEILSLPDIPNGFTVDDFNITQEAKYLIGWWLNTATTRPCKSMSAWTRSKFYGEQKGSFWGEKIRQRIASQLKFIRHWRVMNSSYLSVDIGQEVTWFVDPPYQLQGKNYRYNTIDYEQLACWCYGLPGQVVVCEQDGANWLPFRSFTTIQSNPSSRGKTWSRECIWP